MNPPTPFPDPTGQKRFIFNQFPSLRTGVPDPLFSAAPPRFDGPTRPQLSPVHGSPVSPPPSAPPAMSAVPFDALPANEQVLLEPFYYLCKVPGKEIRSRLAEAFNVWLRVPSGELELIKQAVEMLHTASLLVDDIEDGSLLRRGVPTAHQIYGVPMTINTANYVYFMALSKVQQLASPRAVAVFTDEMLRLHRGQGMEIYWRDARQCPTEAEYLDMVANKTGGLFRLAVQLMQHAAGRADVDYLPLVDLLGRHFQVRDDYINLVSEQYRHTKGYCEDLSEGKYSFPILHSIRAEQGGSQLAHILRQRPTDNDIKAYAVSLMRATRSFEYTFDFLQGTESAIRAELARLGGNAPLEALLGQLVVPAPPGRGQP